MIDQKSNLLVGSITIKNFRTFYGEKEPIELSVDPKKPFPPVTNILLFSQFILQSYIFTKLNLDFLQK